jgi:hypothetical protein
MNDAPDLVVLLYRADWTRLSLAAEVSHTIDHDLEALRSETRVPGAGMRARPRGPHGPVAGSGWRARPTGNEWETATDLQGTETSRSTLLVAPGGRCRHQGDGFVSGCDGDRTWTEFEADGRLVEAIGGPKPPLWTLLRPSWLLTGFTLEILRSATACGRDGLQVVATPRRSIRESTAGWHHSVDRIEVIVDAELGILLRREEIFEGKPLSLTELVSVSFNPAEAADDAQFQPPSGWEAAEKNAKFPSPDGPGWELAKLATGLTARGMGALIKSKPADPFGQATSEEPEAAMPEEEPVAPGASPVSDEVLHLLHDSESRRTPGIEATLHHWHDVATVCDGQRCWKIYDEGVTAGPAAPPPSEIGDLFDPSWLLESRLTGGTETVIGGRRGYRLAVASDDPRWQTMFSPDEVVVDAELGFLLCSISHAGPRTVTRYELRDLITAYTGEAGDFQPDLPPGTPVVEEDPGDGAPPGPVNFPGAMAGAFARKAAKDAQSAVQGFVDFIRGEGARLPANLGHVPPSPSWDDRRRCG